ncbi:MAG: selenocysteine-specific translation elongation factor [Pseudomonadota bacterium]
MTTCAVAVIGHVDHGKTSLVRALTGVDTDRLKEEKARGLSIALGFAHRAYPSGTVDFIDAPGHEDFIRATVSGVTGARAVLLVVSAADGPQPQTLEHLRIADLLGVEHGVVAMSKADLASPEEREARRGEIETILASTRLGDAPIVPVSAETGEGLDGLNASLEALVSDAGAGTRLGGFFLPIDSIFSAPGVGTIVTGTLLGGTVDSGASAVIEPQGQETVARAIQQHGAEVDRAEPGGRTALNLRGVPADAVRRGDVVCAPGVFAASAQLDVSVSLLKEAARPLKHMDDVRVMLGTFSGAASARVLEAKAIEPGERGMVQLRFAEPVAAFAGQRAVLRRVSPAETIGGAVVLDPQAAPARRGDARRVRTLSAAEGGQLSEIAAVLAKEDGGLIRAADAARLARLPLETVLKDLSTDYNSVPGDMLADRQAAEAARAAYLATLDTYHQDNSARTAAPAAEIRAALAARFPEPLVAYAEQSLGSRGDIVLRDADVSLAGRDPRAAMSGADRSALEQLEAALRAGGAAPPDLAEIDGASEDLIGVLLRSGAAIALRNVSLKKVLFFHAEALDAAYDALSKAFPPPTEFKTGEARAVLETTRKYIVPILEHFDKKGLTVRNGDVRRLTGR